MAKTKPKLQTQCKICNLIHRDRDTWTELHTKILKEALKKSHVCRWLNKRVELLNANRTVSQPELKAFNVSNFTIHFKKHVPNLKLMKAELRAAVKEAPRANDGFTPEEQDVASEAINAEADALAESYKGYPDMVAKLEQVIMRDLLTVQGITDSGGKLKSQAAEKNLRLLTNLINVKQGLADVQRTEQVGGSAVRHALVRIGEEVVGSVNKLSVEVRDILGQQLPGSSLPAEIETMITGRVIEMLKGVYPEILAEIYKIYGIK